MSWLRDHRPIVVGVVAAVVLLVVASLLVFPSGESSAEKALLEAVKTRSDDGSPRVLTSEPWGGGELVLARYESGSVRKLALAFVVHRLRGWQVGSYSEQRAEPEDVAVGSLLVATARGGKDQPAWTAVVGELSDARIDSVEVRWKDGRTTKTLRQNDGYLAARDAGSEADVARFLAKDGTEIAAVPARSGD